MGAISDKIKGKAKQVEGRVTGDKLREAQGSAQQAKGDIEGAVDRAKNRARAKIDEMKAKRAIKRASRTR
jgi:uncharacterized protein YjbJ (UPF0337 family)